jgi:hypothetical protein
MRKRTALKHILFYIREYRGFPVVHQNKLSPGQVEHYVTAGDSKCKGYRPSGRLGNWLLCHRKLWWKVSTVGITHGTEADHLVTCRETGER